MEHNLTETEISEKVDGKKSREIDKRVSEETSKD